jgi:hypothetical protein
MIVEEQFLIGYYKRSGKGLVELEHPIESTDFSSILSLNL